MKKTQTMKWVYASSAGVIVLAIFLGWRGSHVVLTNHTAQLQKRVHSEARLAQELASARISEFDTEAFNVISAEYLQHNSRTPGVTPELGDSPFSAVGVLEMKGSSFEPIWWSVSPKARDIVSAEFFRALVPEWQDVIKQMGRHYFMRAADLKQAPLMIVFSRIQLPNSQTPAIALTALPPSALKLNPKSLGEALLFDNKGFIWGYQNSNYVGSSLKSDPVVHAAMKSPEDESELRFRSYGHNRIGYFSMVSESNLYVGLSHEIPSLFAVMTNWWVSILFALIGTAALSFAVIRLLLREAVEVRVEAPVAPVFSPSADVTIEIDPLESQPDLTEEILPLPTPISVPETVAAVRETHVTAAAPQPQPPSDSVDLTAVVQRALGPFRRRCVDDGITLKENLAAGLQVKAKAAQLQTAIEEIIKNALDAMANSETKKLSLETAQEGVYARIQISDTGIGIPKANQEKIFEPFYTTKPESSRGLGLTVVKRLLELVKGESRIDSAPGNGAVFTLLIPMPNVHVVDAPVPAPVADLRLPDFAEEDFGETMSIEPVRDFAKKVEIRKPVVRMFD